MIRTQVSISKKEYKLAKIEAKKLGISLAELVRRSLRELLQEDTSKPWMKYAGFIESGNSRSGETIDEIIYGQKD